MKKTRIFVAVVCAILSFQFSGILYGAIPAKERAALIALYNATDGDNWYSNSGWKSEPLEADGFGPIGSENSWRGVTVSGGHVTAIILQQLSLKGNIPPELGDLDHLITLLLRDNDLTGTIPPELGKLALLETLNLDNNRLSGGIPPEFGNLDNLESLYIEDNQLTTIPAELGNMDSLKRIYLRENQITAIPAELGNLQHLEYILMNDNLLTAIPAGLGNIKTLQILYLNSNQITSLPPELGNLDNLEQLFLEKNQIASIPPELANLDNLESLKLTNNQLTSIPPELGTMDKLNYLALDFNQLTSIPPELGNLAKLEWLYLGHNQLTSIPPELANLSLLKSLTLHDNHLTSIPSELGNLKNMQLLGLSSNPLNTFPPEIWKFSNLTSLAMYNCGLSGSIPSELGNFANLDTLVLSSNQLTGPIPANFTNLTLLHKYSLSLGYNGLYTNDEGIRVFLNERDVDWEETQTIAPANVSAAAVSNSTIRVTWTPILYTGDTGGYKIYTGTSSGGPWTYVGMTADKSAASFDLTGLTPEIIYYIIVKTQTDPHANNAYTVVSDPSEEVPAIITTIPPEQDQPPFGSLDLPLGGDEPLSGSITVSGWALDDVGVVDVKIYNVWENNKTYIGDAVFIEGARPDVEQAFPGYPNNKRAGWGYMLLSNFLSNGGNGTYTLQAIASDFRNHKTILGNKTIVCDNINAVKPFGAIDTPTQGGTASGGNFRNHGWALTPMPNKIPIDGSTINVYVDGVLLGRPNYNIYREDIAGLFPGYANCDGAHAYFDFDTTGYSNGVHTIYWTAADDAGNTDGIGSRYFVIQNAGAGRGNPSWLPAFSLSPNPSWLPGLPDISNIPVDNSSPMSIIKGYKQDDKFLEIYPDDNGIVTVEIKELERIEIIIGEQYNPHPVPNQHTTSMAGGNTPPVKWAGFQVVGGQLRSLPVGSTLDRDNGVFYWSPGPGFIGTYNFVFVEKAGDHMKVKYLNIRITPQ